VFTPNAQAAGYDKGGEAHYDIIMTVIP